MNYTSPLILPYGQNQNPESQLDQETKPLTAAELLRDGKAGQSGTLVYSGIITGEEYNSDLVGKTAIVTWDKMRRSDATVRFAIKILELPILAAKWDIEPASDSPEDVEIAEFLEHNLFEELPFHDIIREALLMLTYGFSVFEKVFEPVEYNGKTYIGLSKLSSRKQYSIFKWEQSTGDPGITQLIANVGLIDIPKDKLVIFTNEKEGQNYEGISILRSAYRSWFMKNALIKIQAMKAERQGLGVPSFTPPVGASEVDKAAARVQMQNLRANEFSYIELPQGYTVDFLDMKASSTENIDPIIRYHDHEIVKNVLAQFADIGSHSGSGGAKSSSQDQSRFLDLSLEAIIKNIANTLMQEVIKHLVDLNFNVTEYPQLTHTKVVEDDFSMIADAAQKLGAAEMLTPDPDLEQFFRDSIHAPALPEEIAEDYANRPMAQPAVPASPSAPGSPDTKNQDEQETKDPDEQIESLDASDKMEAVLAEARKLTRKMASVIADVA